MTLAAIITAVEEDIEEGATDAWDFIKTLVTDELIALAPIVEAAIPTIVADAGALGNPAGWLTAVSGVATALLPKLESVGVNVAGSSLMIAIGTGLTKVATAAGVTPGMSTASPPIDPPPSPEPPVPAVYPVDPVTADPPPAAVTDTAPAAGAASN